MAYRAALLNFTKGEISPELLSRFDLGAYQAGLKVANNVIIQRTGGVAKRMGTRFVAECLGTAAKLFSFQFSDEQGYALEFGQAYMRPLALGGAVLEEGLEVISITPGTTTVVEVNFHAYAVGDLVYFIGIEGMGEINDRWITVIGIPDENHVELDIDSTSFGAFTGSGGGINRVGTPPPPPPPPVVPPPTPTPTPPPVGSGSGGGYTSGSGTGGTNVWKDDWWRDLNDTRYNQI